MPSMRFQRPRTCNGSRQAEACSTRFPPLSRRGAFLGVAPEPVIFPAITDDLCLHRIVQNIVCLLIVLTPVSDDPVERFGLPEWPLPPSMEIDRTRRAPLDPAQDHRKRIPPPRRLL